MKVSLTFDNGPHPATTPEVLAVLERRVVKASFFMVGERLAKPGAPALAAEVKAAGHQIGNHTFTHQMLGTLESPATGIGEIERTQALLGDLAGEARLFRPAGGGGQLVPQIMARASWEHLAQGGYSCVLWNSVPRDWEDQEGWVRTALAGMAGNDWTVLVLHDLPTGAMAHLDSFLEQALDEGAEFTQAFPRSCAPMWRGQVLWEMGMIDDPRDVGAVPG